MSDPRNLSDDQVTTLAGKVAVELTARDHTVDLTNLTLEDFKALAAKAMEQVDAGVSEATNVVVPGTPLVQTLKTTHPVGRPPTCDSDNKRET